MRASASFLDCSARLLPRPVFKIAAFLIARALLRPAGIVSCFEVVSKSALMPERIDSTALTINNVLPTKVDPSSLRFESNMRALADLVAQVRNEEEKIREGGGAKAIESQHAKSRLTARERVAQLADPGSFFELGLYAAHKMYEEWGGAPAAGVITGLARIHSRMVMLVVNDATVKAGAFFPMTAKKVIRAQNIAIENRIPTIYLVDSAGVFLPLQEDVFPDTDDFGRVFRNNAVMSAMGIPQIAAIMGMCVAGGGYLPVMCDHVLMTDGSGFKGGERKGVQFDRQGRIRVAAGLSGTAIGESGNRLRRKAAGEARDKLRQAAIRLAAQDEIHEREMAEGGQIHHGGLRTAEQDDGTRAEFFQALGGLDGNGVAVADGRKAEQICIQRGQTLGRKMAEGRPAEARSGVNILDVPGVGIDNLRLDSDLFENRREGQDAERDIGDNLTHALALELHRIFEIRGGWNADQANFQRSRAVIAGAWA